MVVSYFVLRLLKIVIDFYYQCPRNRRRMAKPSFYGTLAVFDQLMHFPNSVYPGNKKRWLVVSLESWLVVSSVRQLPNKYWCGPLNNCSELSKLYRIMSLLHFKTHNQLPLGLQVPLVRMKTSPQLPQRSQNTMIENLYNLLTKFITEPNYLFVMGPRGDKTRQKGTHPADKFAEMLQVEHSCPIPKLQHRTSIEANLCGEDQKMMSSDNLNKNTMGEMGSSEFHLFESESACASFDATQYLTYLQLQELFERQEPELMVYSVGLLCKYLQTNNESLTRHNVLRLFATSVFLSFKLHLEYDMNIIDFVSETLQMDRKLFSTLEKSFCRVISYDLSVGQNILSWLRRQLLF